MNTINQPVTAKIVHPQFSNPVLPTFLVHPLGARIPIAVLCLAAWLTFSAGDTQAQQTAVCSNTPAEGERIECKEDAASTADIDLDTEGPVIKIMGVDTPGIHAEHKGEGDIKMNLLSRSDPVAGFISTTITRKGSSQGVYANHEGTGDIELFAPFTIVNTGVDGGFLRGSHGIHARHVGVGDIEISAPGADITVNGDIAYGIFGIIGKTEAGVVQSGEAMALN